MIFGRKPSRIRSITSFSVQQSGRPAGLINQSFISFVIYPTMSDVLAQLFSSQQRPSSPSTLSSGLKAFTATDKRLHVILPLDLPIAIVFAIWSVGAPLYGGLLISTVQATQNHYATLRIASLTDDSLYLWSHEMSIQAYGPSLAPRFWNLPVRGVDLVSSLVSSASRTTWRIFMVSLMLFPARLFIDYPYHWVF